MEKNHEKELISKLLHSDSQALHTLYKTYHKDLFNFVYSRIRQKHEAEELAQDILIHFLESIRDFRYQCSIKTFLFTIARNKIIDYIRKKKVKKIAFSHLPSFVLEGLTTVFMDDELEKKDLQEKLEKTFSKLPKDYQLVIRLKYIENKSVQEIAGHLMRSFKSTESLLFRARKAFIQIYSNLS